MASRRDLKRAINAEIADVIDHCYDIVADAPEKEAKMNEIVDASVELYDRMIIAINSYKSAENKGAYFAELEANLDKELQELNKKVTKL